MSQQAKQNILIVEDNVTNVEILLNSLKDNYTVRVAVDGERALKTIDRRIPDLVLLDVMLPGMDGFELCQRLKGDSRTRHVPVIFLTGCCTPQDRLLGFNAGGSDFLTKPFDMAEVKTRIRQHLPAAN